MNLESLSWKQFYLYLTFNTIISAHINFSCNATFPLASILHREKKMQQKKKTQQRMSEAWESYQFVPKKKKFSDVGVLHTTRKLSNP
jgi:hypothetical protein